MFTQTPCYKLCIFFVITDSLFPLHALVHFCRGSAIASSHRMSFCLAFHPGTTRVAQLRSCSSGGLVTSGITAFRWGVAGGVAGRCICIPLPVSVTFPGPGVRPPVLGRRPFGSWDGAPSFYLGRRPGLCSFPGTLSLVRGILGLPVVSCSHC